MGTSFTIRNSIRAMQDFVYCERCGSKLIIEELGEHNCQEIDIWGIDGEIYINIGTKYVMLTPELKQWIITTRRFNKTGL